MFVTTVIWRTRFVMTVAPLMRGHAASCRWEYTDQWFALVLALRSLYLDRSFPCRSRRGLPCLSRVGCRVIIGGRQIWTEQLQSLPPSAYHDQECAVPWRSAGNSAPAHRTSQSAPHLPPPGYSAIMLTLPRFHWRTLPGSPTERKLASVIPWSLC